MEPKDLDFTVVEGLEFVKKFNPTDSDGVPVDMTGNTVRLKARRQGGDETLNATIENAGLTASFTFTTAFTNLIETIPYVVYQTTPGGDVEYLFEGTIKIESEFSFSNDIDTLIENLKPDGVLLNPSFKFQQIRFWKLYLQNLITPTILDEELDDDTNWPPLVNYLIAYLVIYDFLKKYARKSYSDMFGNGAADAEGAQIKKIETGPTNVEFHDSAKAITSMFKPDQSGNTPFKEMTSEICQLSKRLRIYLPMCGHLERDTNLPIIHYQEKPSTLNLILTTYYG